MREFRAGYAEVAKYGLIDRPRFFRLAGDRTGARCLPAAPARTRPSPKSCRAKADVVARDEFETGDRALLNLGHTFGHALEAATGYDGARLVHGEGVAIGMALAHRFSARLNLASPDDAARVEAHLRAVGLPWRMADIPGELPDAERLLGYIAQDKKVSRGALTFILTRGIGQSFIARDVPASEVLSFLREQSGLKDDRGSAGWAVVAALAGLACWSRWLAQRRCLRAFRLRAHAHRAAAFARARNCASAVDDFDRDGTDGQAGSRPPRRPARAAELEVSDVMVHRTNMRSVNADNPPEAMVREILQSPHTRMPLWKGSLDNIVGVLHAKDLLRALNDAGNDFSQDRRDEDRVKAMVRARHDQAAGPTQRLPAPQGNARFSVGTAAVSTAFFALLGGIFALTQYLQFAHGYSAIEAGAIMTPMALGLAIGAGSSSKAVARLGTSRVVAGGLFGVALMLGVTTLWDPSTSAYVLTAWFFGLTLAMGWVMAPATDAVVGAVPAAKSGVASATNTVARMVSGALGVAIIGSLVSSLYSNKVEGSLGALPPPLQTQAEDSIGAANAIAAQLPPQAASDLLATTGDAFTQAMGIGLAVGAALVAAAAVLVLRLLPAREAVAEPEVRELEPRALANTDQAA